MSRTFILQKDLPNYKAGVRLIRDTVGSMYQFEQNDINGEPDAWAAKLVENNTEFFREEKPEKVDVTLFRTNGTDCLNGMLSYSFAVSKQLKGDEFTAIQSAIESALNGTSTIFDAHQAALEQMSQMYTQEQLNKAIENAFFAAREINVIQLKDVDVFKKFVYPTVTSYMESLKEKV